MCFVWVLYGVRHSRHPRKWAAHIDNLKLGRHQNPSGRGRRRRRSSGSASGSSGLHRWRLHLGCGRVRFGWCHMSRLFEETFEVQTDKCRNDIDGVQCLYRCRSPSDKMNRLRVRMSDVAVIECSYQYLLGDHFFADKPVCCQVMVGNSSHQPFVAEAPRYLVQILMASFSSPWEQAFRNAGPGGCKAGLLWCH